jgi:hypothetical protein
MHVVAEMLNWLDEYVKNAPPRRPGDTGSR